LDAQLPGKDGAHDSFSAMRHEARIVMHVHVRVGFDGLDIFTRSTLANPSAHEQPIETSQLAPCDCAHQPFPPRPSVLAAPAAAKTVERDCWRENSNPAGGSDSNVSLLDVTRYAARSQYY
jgi:hypothetical protein